MSGGKAGRYRDAKHPKSLPVAYSRSNDSTIRPAEFLEVCSWLRIAKQTGRLLRGLDDKPPGFGFVQVLDGELASIFRLSSYYFDFVTKLETKEDL